MIDEHMRNLDLITRSVYLVLRLHFQNGTEKLRPQ